MTPERRELALMRVARLHTRLQNLSTCIQNPSVKRQITSTKVTINRWLKELGLGNYTETWTFDDGLQTALKWWELMKCIRNMDHAGKQNLWVHIANGQGACGGFLTSFAKAYCVADLENQRLMNRTGDALIWKYDLLQNVKVGRQ